MKTSESSQRTSAAREVEHAPSPTYAPAAMAMGVAMLAWGFLTHCSMSLAGGGLVAWALWSWMGDVARQWSASE
jgi:hypothetical protein